MITISEKDILGFLNKTHVKYFRMHFIQHIIKNIEFQSQLDDFYKFDIHIINIGIIIYIFDV